MKGFLKYFGILKWFQLLLDEGHLSKSVGSKEECEGLITFLRGKKRTDEVC